MNRIEFIGIKLPIIEPKHDLPRIILESINKSGYELKQGDIILITLKIVSKYLGLLYNIDEIEVDKEAYELSMKTGLDPKYLELLIRESDKILAAIPFKELINIKRFAEKYGYDPNSVYEAINRYPTLFITLRGGSIWTDSGIDSSNHPPNIYSIPPRDPDDIAKRLSITLSSLTGFKVPIILCDTELFPWGALDIARGAYGIEVLTREFGKPDLYGKPKFGGVDNIAYSLCASAGLLFRQADEGVPVVIARGVGYNEADEGLKSQIPYDFRESRLVIKKILKYNVKILGIRRMIKTIFRYII